MTFPIGEYVIFGIGLYYLGCGNTRRSRIFWGGVWLSWLTGWILESIFPWNNTWHWHFSRVMVLGFFAGMAWQRTKGRKILPVLITASAFAAQNLFIVNEPSIFKGEQFFLGAMVLVTVVLTTHDFWGMGLALAGGILADLGISIFLFQGIVRHYDLPDPFFWNLSVLFLAGAAGVRMIWKKRNDVLTEMSEKE
ncbi:hypothetical protein [Desulfitobacterium sp.]|uniref:hypothetical protein n=1 Tax=Desulfitobacterium sp. TaxID=49981 RepID=UPI002B21D697|nr:hypothetical protein [Desulfitobacterium sp.]MEA4902379.1 hypothetical protein [Desulfitobacterium sp.]